jgi:hypothetical protein
VPRIPRNLARGALAALDLFAAVTAIGGGVALMARAERDRFPDAWLIGTPFNSYLVPGLILAVAVGGSAAVAAAVTLRDPRRGAAASTLAGLVMLGWICGEIAVLTRDPGPVSTTEFVYLAVGAAMAGLGASRWVRPSTIRRLSP